MATKIYKICKRVNARKSATANIFDSTTVATAIADRLVYNSEALSWKEQVIEKDQEKTDKYQLPK